MGRLVAVLIHEVRAAAPAALFFLVALNLLVLTVSLAAGEPIAAVSHATASLGALLVAKGVLLADHLPFAERAERGPLIRPTLLKAGLYWLAATAVHLAERLITAALSPGGFAAGLGEAWGAMNWGVYAAGQIWLAVLLVLFAGIRELWRALGPETARAMVFGGPARP
jgi:hypothetical protein